MADHRQVVRVEDDFLKLNKNHARQHEQRQGQVGKAEKKHVRAGKQKQAQRRRRRQALADHPKQRADDMVRFRGRGARVMLLPEIHQQKHAGQRGQRARIHSRRAAELGPNGPQEGMSSVNGNVCAVRGDVLNLEIRRFGLAQFRRAFKNRLTPSSSSSPCVSWRNRSSNSPVLLVFNKFFVVSSATISPLLSSTTRWHSRSTTSNTCEQNSTVFPARQIPQ